MNISLRLEQKQDYRVVEELTREAFWGFTTPACDEHLIAHRLREIPAFVPELDYVAEIDTNIVGNIMYSKAKIIDNENVSHEVLTFGPLSVLPGYWNKGVGSALVKHTIDKAGELGYRAIVFYGHPDYYPRFGFKRGSEYNITNPDGKSFDSLMAMPLYDGALNGITGKFYEDSIFHLNEAEVEEFNKGFTFKEPVELTSINVLTSRLEGMAADAFSQRNIKTLPWLTRFSGSEIQSWEGIDEKAMAVINKTLAEYGYAKKRFSL